MPLTKRNSLGDNLQSPGLVLIQHPDTMNQNKYHLVPGFGRNSVAREAEGKEGRANPRVVQGQQASVSPRSGCGISCSGGFSGCITCTGLT